MLVLAGLAAAVRLSAVHSSGGFRTTMAYDDGVYFASTNAFLDGLMPYRDFVLLHPPGILVLGAAPVWLAHALGLDDSGSLVLVRGLFLAMGSLNTVLVFLAGRHLSRTTGLLAAALYAVWLPAVREERTMLLEPVVAMGTLAALVLVPAVSHRRAGSKLKAGSQRWVHGTWRPVLAGVLGGIAVATKVWAVVPLLVVVGSLAVVRRWRDLAAYVIAGAVSVAAFVGPFLAAAPRQLPEMVVTDQLGRPPMGDSLWLRLAMMMDLEASPLTRLISPEPPPDLLINLPVHDAFYSSDRAHLVVGVFAVIVAALSLLVAIRLPAARVWVALLAVQTLVLLKVPTFFSGYPAYVAPAIVLVAGSAGHLAWVWLGGGAARAASTASRPRAHTHLLRVVSVGLVALLGALAAGTATARIARPFDPAITALVAKATCVATDSPTHLALSGTLSRNLENGCMPVFDPGGVVYTLARPGPGSISTSDLRRDTAQFQSFMIGYLGSADHVILSRWRINGLTPETMASVHRRPMLRAEVPRVYGPG